MTIDEATALLEAFAELYHAAWYEDKASPSVCNDMRDMLAALIAKARLSGAQQSDGIA